MEKNSIRVGQQSKIKIEVNDAGEYIEINPDDKRFTLKLNGLIRTFREEQAKVMKSLEALTDSEEDALKALEIDAEISKSIAKALDDTFGEGTCKKVYGEGVIPSLDLIGEFLLQISPLIQREMMKRRQRIGQKYSAKRRGSV